MQIKGILHLSLKNLKSHPKRTLFLILTTGIIFALIFTVNLWWQGLQNTYIANASHPTHGKIILQATANSNTTSFPNDSSTSQDSPATREEMIQDLERFGATIIGDTKYYGSYFAPVLDSTLLQSVLEIDPTTAPAGTAPILVNEHLANQFLGKAYSGVTRTAHNKQQNYETYRSSLLGKTFTDSDGNKYYVVGLAPGRSFINNLSFAGIVYRNDSLFNPFLEHIATPSSTSIVLSNPHASNPQDLNSTPALPASVIATFDSLDQANIYLHHGDGNFFSLSLPNRKYDASVLAGPSPEIFYLFRGITVIINITSAILITIAGVVVIFTTIRLVDQDKQNIKLYYSLGASSRQIHILYLFYFLELLLGAVLFAFTPASLAVLLFSATHQELLSVQQMLAFSLPTRQTIIWYGVNSETFLFFAIILLLAPLCTLLNHHTLANK